MGSWVTEVGAVFGAIMSYDSWEMNQAFRTEGAWIVGFFATLIGGLLVVQIYKRVPFIDKHLERTVMVWTYLIISAVIFVEVFRRFILSEQAPWSTTLPPFLFLIMTWFGCSYNVRLRTHLAFAELRMNLPRAGQLATLCLDATLWFVFCWVVVVTSMRVVANSAANFHILLGTDDILQWWFLVTVPISFILLCARVFENLHEDFANYRSGADIISPAVIGGE